MSFKGFRSQLPPLSALSLSSSPHPPTTPLRDMSGIEFRKGIVGARSGGGGYCADNVARNGVEERDGSNKMACREKKPCLDENVDDL